MVPIQYCKLGSKRERKNWNTIIYWRCGGTVFCIYLWNHVAGEMCCCFYGSQQFGDHRFVRHFRKFNLFLKKYFLLVFLPLATYVWIWLCTKNISLVIIWTVCFLKRRLLNVCHNGEALAWFLLVIWKLLAIVPDQRGSSREDILQIAAFSLDSVADQYVFLELLTKIMFSLT